MTARLIIPILAAAAAFAQSGPKLPEFEVASIRPAPLDLQNVHIGIRVDGAQVHIAGYSLKDYVRVAYRVKDYQVEGPEWIASERYNVDATLPAGATRDQVNDMLQSLLRDRFKVEFHRIKKEFPVYALVVSKGGAKIKESAVDSATAAALAKPPDNVNASGSAAGVFVAVGPGASYVFADNKITAQRLSMSRFADILARFVDKPVVDMTNLASYYDFTLNVTEEDYRAMLIRSAITAGVELPPQVLQMAAKDVPESLAASMQSVGLKLDNRKAPLDVIVVDRAEKSPVDN